MRLFRMRITVGGMMIVVAASAVLMNHFRPLGEAEAVRIAMAYTRRTQPEYQLDKLRGNAYWIKGVNYYVIIWENPNSDEDLDLPNNLLVNSDGRCTEYTGIASLHHEAGTKDLILDSYLPLSKAPFENVPFGSY